MFPTQAGEPARGLVGRAAGLGGVDLLQRRPDTRGEGTSVPADEDFGALADEFPALVLVSEHFMLRIFSAIARLTRERCVYLHIRGFLKGVELVSVEPVGGRNGMVGCRVNTKTVLPGAIDCR